MAVILICNPIYFYIEHPANHVLTIPTLGSKDLISATISPKETSVIPIFSY